MCANKVWKLDKSKEGYKYNLRPGNFFDYFEK